MTRALIRRLSALEETLAPADPLVVVISCFQDLRLSGFDVQGVGVVDRLPGETEDELYDRAVAAAMSTTMVVIHEKRYASSS